MADNNKNKNNDLPDFLRYRSGEMTGKEKNAFERNLQKDRLSEEATEGLASLSPDEIIKDITTLQKRLKTRTKKRQRFIIYRIAASIAVLMIISSVFLIVERNKPERQLSETTVYPQMLEINKSDPIRAPGSNKEEPETKVQMEMKKPGKSPDKNPITVNNDKALQVEGIKIPTAQTVDQIPENKTKAVDKNISADIVAAPAAIQTAEKSVARKDVSAMGAKSDSQVMVSRDTARSALSEVFFVGYGRTKSEAGKNDTLSGYSPPQPVGGKIAFDNYILENLHHPDSVSAGQNVAVVLSFIVQTNGKIDSIRIVKSPDKSFSDEAIRLVKSGPQWKPAQKDGNAIKEDVRIKIVFK
jgi:TonB family protein